MKEEPITTQSAKNLKTEELKKKKKELEYLVSRYNNIQQTRKVQLNSAYGAFGNKHFRYYDVRIAGSVTLAGQYVTRKIDQKINEYFNKILKTQDHDYVVFSHTDSMYICLAGVVKQFFGEKKDLDPEVVVKALEKACSEKIYPKIKKILEEVSIYTNGLENRMNMKIECIADRGVWTGKNRYVLNVYYKEGTFYRHPFIKPVGIEVVKSSIPSVCRGKIMRALEIILRENEVNLRKFIRGFRKEYDEFSFEDIGIPIGIRRSIKGYDGSAEDKVYLKGTPKHIKGALVYNHQVKAHGLSKEYNTIKEGDKVKFLTLKLPNPIHETVISFPDVLPSEFGLEEYVDRDQMFLVSFMNPVNKVLSAVRWKLKEVATIESIFEKEV